MMPYFTIKSEHALVDQPIVIKVEGLEPGGLVTIRLQFTDDRQQIWASSVEFIADASGTVDLQSMQPIRGDYREPDLMGLFWSLQLLDSSATSFPFLFSATRSATPLQFTVTAEINGGVVTTASIVRQFYADSVERTEIVTPGLVATFFRPRTAGRYPTAITVGGSGGNFGWARQVAGLLASYGRATLAVAYFDWAGEYGLPTELKEIPLEIIQRAIDYLRTVPGINLADLAILGFSKGAELALVAATVCPEIQRVVAYMPSSVIWEGIQQMPGLLRSSWGYHGKPLPFVSNSMQGNYYPNMVQVIQQFQSAAPPMRDELIQTVIPVEKIRGPLLLISGANDRVWPSAAMADLIMVRLQQHQHPFANQHICLQRAGHAVGVPFLPYSPVNPDEVAAMAQGTSQAWQTVKQFVMCITD
jgi:acetyl esterase/lipase